MVMGEDLREASHSNREALEGLRGLDWAYRGKPSPGRPSLPGSPGQQTRPTYQGKPSPGRPGPPWESLHQRGTSEKPSAAVGKPSEASGSGNGGGRGPLDGFGQVRCLYLIWGRRFLGPVTDYRVFNAFLWEMDPRLTDFLTCGHRSNTD